MWEYVIVSAIIYGLIAMLAIWLRGRMIRKTITQYSKRLEQHIKRSKRNP